MVSLCVLGVAGFASNGIQLIIWMHSLGYMIVLFLCVLGVAGFTSKRIQLII